MSKKSDNRIHEPSTDIVQGSNNKPLDVEDQIIDTRYLTRMTKDNFLTNVFHDPSLLAPKSNIISNYILAGLGNRVGYTSGNKVFCIYLELDEKKASYWRLAALFLSILRGMGTGVGSKNARLGLDVGTAMLAILLVLQGSLNSTSSQYQVLQ